MKILFYGTKNYDRESFGQQLKHFPNIELDYIEAELDTYTVYLAHRFDGICVLAIGNIVILQEKLLKRLATYMSDSFC